MEIIFDVVRKLEKETSTGQSSHNRGLSYLGTLSAHLRPGGT
jgi:hypothetical protein